MYMHQLPAPVQKTVAALMKSTGLCTSRYAFKQPALENRVRRFAPSAPGARGAGKSKAPNIKLPWKYVLSKFPKCRPSSVGRA